MTVAPRSRWRRIRYGVLALAVVAVMTPMLIEPAFAVTQTFVNPGQHTFVVPAGVTEITATVTGASGGPQSGATASTAGRGAIVSGTFAVTPSETLTVYVGGVGGSGTTLGSGGSGGFGFASGAGGGNGGTFISLVGGGAGGGGGASAVVQTNGSTPLIVGGGGGGGGGRGWHLNTPLAGGHGGDAGSGGTNGATSGGVAVGAGGTCCRTASRDGGPGGPGLTNNTGANGGGGGGGGGYNGEAGGGGHGGGAGGTNEQDVASAGGGGAGGQSWVLDAVIPDPPISGTTGNGQVVLTYTVLTPTTTTLTSGSNPSVVGSPVTFTATVAGSGGTPTGTVTFFDGASALGGPVDLVNGVAVFTTSGLAVGPRTITAVFSGDAAFAGSTSSPVVQQVTSPATTTTLSSSPNPSAPGQAVTFTAAVTSPTGDTPTGTVTFYADGAALSGALPLDAAGQAVFTTDALAEGSHAMTAEYSGGVGFDPSTSNTVTQRVIGSGWFAGIANTANQAQSGSVGLSENDDCPAPGDGQWHPCAALNKFGGGNLAAGATRTTTVTLRNTGTVPAGLFLLPSQCRDSLTGAHGSLCDRVTVQVSCGTTAVIGPPAVTLNAFHDGWSFPTGYPAGTLAGGASVDCMFTLTASAPIPAGGTVSQPISWKLTLGN